MPLKKEDAERVLGLLWELWEFNKASTTIDEGQDEPEDVKKDKEAFFQAISMLQSYLTNILPAAQPSLRINEAVHISLTSQSKPQTVKLTCGGQQKLGIELQQVDESTPGVGNFYRFYVSHIEKESIAKASLKVGDIVLEINGRPLVDVTLERARWLLKKAARSHEISLLIVTSDGRSMYIAKKRPAAEMSTTAVELTAAVADISNIRLTGKRLHVKNKAPMKIKLQQEQSKGGWGVKLDEGKTTLIKGGSGIFVSDVDKSRPAGREGALMKGDEVLMVNHKSVAGLTKQEVIKAVRSSSQCVDFVIAREVPKLSSSSTVSLESIEVPEAEKLIAYNGERPQPPLPTAKPPLAASMLNRESPAGLRVPGSHAARHDIELREISLQVADSSIQHITAQPGYATTQLIEQERSSSPSIAQLAEKPLTQWGRFSATSSHSVPPEPSEKTVVLKKEGNRLLGFSLCGGKGSQRGDVGIFIRRIQPGGLAEEDGRVKEGDELLEINENPLTDYTHKMAAHLIKELSGLVALKLKTGPGFLSIPKKLKHKLSVKGTSFTVALELDEGESLGFQIAGLTDDRDEYGIFISEIDSDSAAGKCKLLHVSDQLIEVNGQSLLEMSVGEAEAILATIPAGTVKLEVVRPSSVVALGRLLADKDKRSTGSRGSFRMCATGSVHDDSDEEPPPPPLPVNSLLDKDIIELFSQSESGSQEDLKQKTPPTSPDSSTKLLDENAATQFPSLAEALESTKEDDSILASVTPILSRPSIAATISRSSSVHESDTTVSPAEEINEMQRDQQQQRQSGLFVTHTAENEDQVPTRDHEEEALVSEDTMGSPPLLPSSPPPPPPPPEENEHHENLLPEDTQQPTLLMTESEAQPGTDDDQAGEGGTPSPPLPQYLPPSPPLEKMSPRALPPAQSANDDLPTPYHTNINGSHAAVAESAGDDSPGGDSPMFASSPSISHKDTSDADEVPPTLPNKPPPVIVEGSFPDVSASSTDAVNNPSSVTDETSPPTTALSSDIPAPTSPPPPLPATTEPLAMPTEPSTGLSEKDSPQFLDTTYTEQPSSATPNEPPPNLPEGPPPPLPVTTEHSAAEPPSATPNEQPPTLPEGAPPPIIPDDTPPFPSVEPQPALPEDKPDANQTLPSSQRLIPTPPPPYQNQTLQNNSSATPQPSSQKSTSSSSASVSKERGEEGEIYEVHVQKGLRGLGIKVATNESGMVIVKSLASSSPITKDGTMRLGDILMSINGKEIAKMSVRDAEGVIKAVPRGLVKIVAMVPRKYKPTKELPKITETPVEKDEDEGVVTVKLTRKGDTPLGIEVEGGSDTSLHNIYITVITPDSAAAKNGQLRRGDQIIMCGEKCLVGTTSVEAWHILKEAPKKVEITVSRKKESQKLNFRGSSTDLTKPTPVQEAPLPPMRSRVTSSSLHFASITPSTSNQDGLNKAPSTEDVRGDSVNPGAVLTPASTILQPSAPAAGQTPTQPGTGPEFTIVLHRQDKTPFGFSVKGGVDKPELPRVHVKIIQPDGIAAADGRLRKGDQLLEVNGHKVEGLTHKEAVNLLKNAGNTLTLVLSRRISSKARARKSSKSSSHSGSGESTPKSSGSPSPVIITRSVSKKRLSLIESMSGDAQDIKVVELYKGPTGLGIHLSGSLNKDSKVPITIKEVLPGGAAYKSGKISIGDVIMEANGIPFGNLSMHEAMKTIKALPQGNVRLVLMDRKHANNF